MRSLPLLIIWLLIVAGGIYATLKFLNDTYLWLEFPPAR